MASSNTATHRACRSRPGLSLGLVRGSRRGWHRRAGPRFPIQRAAWERKTFEFGSWGGEIRPEFAPQPGELLALEHWCSSGFANTDLDLLLQQRGIEQLIAIGLIAHTCLEATVRSVRNWQSHLR